MKFSSDNLFYELKRAPSRTGSFVWIALAILTIDSLVYARRTRGVSDVADLT